VPIFVDLGAPIFIEFFGVSSTLLAKALPDGAPVVLTARKAPADAISAHGTKRWAAKTLTSAS